MTLEESYIELGEERERSRILSLLESRRYKKEHPTTFEIAWNMVCEQLKDLIKK